MAKTANRFTVPEIARERSPTHTDDPGVFGMFGRPYDGGGPLSNNEHRDYMHVHSANQCGSGAYNHRAGMGGDGADIYDDWLSGEFRVYDEGDIKSGC